MEGKCIINFSIHLCTCWLHNISMLLDGSVMHLNLICNNKVFSVRLMFQGLTDPEEFVVVKAIEAMTSLSSSGLLQKSSLYDLLTDVACYLIHPNLWIRQVRVAWNCGVPAFKSNWLWLLNKYFIELKTNIM